MQREAALASHTAEEPQSARLHRDRRAGFRGGRRRHGAVAVHPADEPGRLHAGAGLHRGRSVPRQGRPGHHRGVARQAGVHPQPHAGGDQEGESRSSSPSCPTPAPATTTLPEKAPATDPNRTKKGHENWLVLVGICTHLGCIPKGQSLADCQGRLRRLVLPLPRLALRHRGPHPQRPGAAQSRGAALRVHVRHQDQDRLRDLSPMATHRIDLSADLAHRASGSTRGCRSRA